MHLLYTSLAILVAVTAPAQCATLRQYSRDWLISDLEPRETKRITAKSVFIAPNFDRERCSHGYREDSSGRCVKLVRVSQTAQLDFLLQKLNAMYGTPMGQPETAPLQIDLAVPVRSVEVTTSAGSSTEWSSMADSSTEISILSSGSSISTSVSSSVGVTFVSSSDSVSSTSGSSTETSLPVSPIESPPAIVNSSEGLGSSTESSTEITTTATSNVTESTSLESSTSFEDLPTTILTSMKEEFMENYPPHEVILQEELSKPDKESIPQVVLITNNEPSNMIKDSSHGVDSVQILEEDIPSSPETTTLESETSSVYDVGIEETSTDIVSEFPIVILDGVKVDNEDLDFGGATLEAEIDYTHMKHHNDGKDKNANMKVEDLPLTILTSIKEEFMENDPPHKVILQEELSKPDKETGSEEDNIKLGTEFFDEPKEVVNNTSSSASNFDTRVVEPVPDNPRLPTPDIPLDNLSVASQMPVSKPTRNSYPGIEDILNLKPKPEENFAHHVQSHNLNPSQLVPPVFENQAPLLNQLPDYPFGLDEIRSPEIPPLQVFRPFQMNPNNYNIQQQAQYPYQQNQNQNHRHQNPGFIRFPTDNQRFYSQIDNVDQKVNTVKFPQEGTFSDDKFRQWANGWRIDTTRVHQRPAPPPSMRFWPKMPLVRNVDDATRRHHHDRRRPSPQYF